MRGADAVVEAADALAGAGMRYALVDAIADQDLLTIGAAAKDMAFLTGGPCIAIGLPVNFGASAPRTQFMPEVQGRSIVLAGSCAAATRQQIAAVQDDWPVLKLDPDRIAAGAPVVDEAIDWASNAPDTPLIYASAVPEEVAATQSKYGVAKAGHMIEETFAQIAQGLVARDFARFVVAGGETSGAMLNGFKVDALHIFGEIDPGFPWTASADGSLALVLKSGNFGGPDFFDKAFRVLS